MFNSDILDHLINKYGIDNVILFCEMESEKNRILFESIEEDQRYLSEPSELGFERDWWAESGKQLKQRV